MRATSPSPKRSGPVSLEPGFRSSSLFSEHDNAPFLDNNAQPVNSALTDAPEFVRYISTEFVVLSGSSEIFVNCTGSAEPFNLSSW